MSQNHSADTGYQAFRLLQLAFILAAFIAGFDKFFYSLTNWSLYISKPALEILNGHDRVFMTVVGIIEVIVGIGLIFKPRIFAYILAVWLFAIIINLLVAGFFDIALRDFGLMLSAIALAKLSYKYGNHSKNKQRV